MTLSDIRTSVKRLLRGLTGLSASDPDVFAIDVAAEAQPTRAVAKSLYGVASA
ncbi:hypothetical protein J2W56_006811 [Nocardia kruczakiae]|uniref:Uncharacterized protein n=1 Tax=Nocardia kruczakiae TaxID=261477 RepID=A0ABU1XR50_9NOCA|nr:hypothetical protein [Nocardia kruczakiae]MDR7173045.1 hypothetical protein [Nocardia kruczakiae]